MFADLEQKWGMTLLERSKSGVCLTSAGEPVRPFLLLEHSGKAEVSDLLERAHVQSDVHFTAWDDYAIMSMVENGLGISVLPELILRRVPYRIVTRPLDVPAYRDIALALRDKETASLAVKRFLEYLKFR